MAYKFLPHTADTKIQAEGKSLEEAFSESAKALKEAIAGKIKIKTKENKEINVQGKDKESLLYSFIEEFLYLIDAEDFILSKIQELKIKEENNQFSLTALAIGDKASSYKFNNGVKAITYNDMSIKEVKSKVTIIFVLDI